MYQFNVADMTCGHCVSTITKALKDADAEAKVDIALGERRVAVQSGLAQEEIADAIREAGYTPKPA
ncbi:MAG TPA: heavy-metal-associated domain-containing protein [Burkholderiales bacterium]|nr:heavy-metal-associated domain-containing protein [Burkholderiales bacterium]